MNTISVDGKNYVKAKEIARELGYTTDYVGQLCRAKKIDAQLVGRSWYVNEGSIRSHKQTRYRSNKQETIKAARKTLHAVSSDESESHKVAVHTEEKETNTRGYAAESFYARAVAKPVAQYHSDDSDLIPGKNTSAKTGKVGVRLADAQNVRISSKTAKYDFETSERPTLRFKGKLSVTDIENYDEEEVQEEVLAAPQPDTNPVKVSVQKDDITDNKTKTKEISSNLEKQEKAHKINVVHRKPTTKKKKKNLPLEHNAEGILGMQRSRIVARNPIGGTLKVNANPNAEASAGVSSVLLAVMLLLSIIGSVFALSLEQTLVVEAGQSQLGYAFNFENLLAATYDALR